MSETEVEVLVADADERVAAIFVRLRALVGRLVPDAVEEPDPSARLLGFSFQPGTYKGLIVGIAPHGAHVNLMFARGAELVDVDDAGLLEGTGKRARHVKLRDVAEVDRAELAALIEEAARRTPRRADGGTPA